MIAWWSWILTAVGVFGLYLAGRKSPWGWAVGIGAQVLWFAYAVNTRQWGFVVSCIAYGSVYIRNFRAWRKPPVAPPTDGHAFEWKGHGRTFEWKGGEVTVTAPMSEAEYEALKTCWLKLHGNKHAASHVTELKPHPTEEPS